MATFRPVRGVAPSAQGCPCSELWAPSSCRAPCPITYTHDYNTLVHTKTFHMSVLSLLGGRWGWWWVHERERGSGCSGAAQAFSGVQRMWRLEKTRRARLKNPQCAHTGTLEPRVGACRGPWRSSAGGRGILNDSSWLSGVSETMGAFCCRKPAFSRTVSVQNNEQNMRDASERFAHYYSGVDMYK